MTSLKLGLANIWLPESIKKKELANIESTTISALVGLLEETRLGKIETIKLETPTGSTEERRAAIARNHRRLVAELAEERGSDEAVRLSRKTLFKVGLSLGEKARNSLGVGNNPVDLLKAAKVLYGILGIQFTVRGGSDTYSLKIHTCALSKHYTEQTCDALSSVDEGVAQGLNPTAKMQFVQKITSGCPTCIALIRFRKVGR